MHSTHSGGSAMYSPQQLSHESPLQCTARTRHGELAPYLAPPLETPGIIYLEPRERIPCARAQHALYIYIMSARCSRTAVPVCCMHAVPSPRTASQSHDGSSAAAASALHGMVHGWAAALSSTVPQLHGEIPLALRKFSAPLPPPCAALLNS